ncbi:hypothetical protein ABIB66_006677 [Bradyrhizobium sp. F1.13.3]
MRKRVEAVFPIVVADAGGPGAAKRHDLDEQVHIHQVHTTPLADEPVDGFLVAAKIRAASGRPVFAIRIIASSKDV